MGLTARSVRWVVHCGLGLKALSQQNQYVMVETGQHFYKAAEPAAAAAAAATIEAEALCGRRQL